MSLARKILGNTAAQVAGRFLTALLAVLVVKILTPYLGQAGYGQYILIYEILAFAGAFADFGIFTIVIREMSKHSEKQQKIFGNALSLRVLSTAMFMLLISGLIFLIPKYSGTVIPLALSIAAISTFFVILSGTLSAALQIKMRMELSAISLVVGKVLTVFLIVLLTQNFYPEATETSFYLLIWAGTFGAFLTCLLTWFFTRKHFPFRFQWDTKEIKQIFIEAAPFGIALALNVAYLKIDVILLSALLPNPQDGVCYEKFCGDTENGKYGVGVRIMDILLMIPIYFMNSVLPTLSERLSKVKKSTEEIAQLLKNSFQFLVAIGLSGGVLLFLLAREVVIIISDPSFLSTATTTGSDTALQILAFFIPLAFSSFFFGFLLIASGNQRKLIWINLMAVLFNIATNFVAIPYFGFQGAAATTVLSEIIMLSLMIFFVLRVPTLRFSIRPIFFIIPCALFAGGLTYLFQVILPWTDSVGMLTSLLTLLLTAGIFVGIFATLLWKTNVITPETLQAFRKSDISS